MDGNAHSDLYLLGDGLLAKVKASILVEGNSQKEDRVNMGLVHHLKKDSKSMAFGKK